MKVIIAGSRSIDDYAYVEKVIKKSNFTITEVVCGEARGVDSLGKRYAEENDIPVKSFYANWKKYGKAAGMMRNNDMVDYADALIVVWDGISRGARDILKKASRLLIYSNIHISEHNEVE